MNTEQCRRWLLDSLDVSRETLDRLEHYETLVGAENTRQNLVSATTLASFWHRHIVDSAQLVALSSSTPGRWLDIGSGAGIPGIVTAIITGSPTVLVEPRSRRAAFLASVVGVLRLTNVTVEAKAIEKVAPVRCDVITARAVAPLPKLVGYGARFAHDGTLWLLPKGRSAHAELALLDDRWQSRFSTVTSVTDPHSQIIMGHGVPKSKER